MSRWIECRDRWININAVDVFEIDPVTDEDPTNEDHDHGYMLFAIIGPQRYPIKAAYDPADLNEWIRIILSQND